MPFHTESLSGHCPGRDCIYIKAIPAKSMYRCIEIIFTAINQSLISIESIAAHADESKGPVPG